MSEISLQAKIDQLSRDSAKQQAEITIMKTDNAIMKTEIANMKIQNADLLTQIDVLENQINRLTTENNELKAENAQIKQDLRKFVKVVVNAFVRAKNEENMNETMIHACDRLLAEQGRRSVLSSGYK